jgi:hypothetical protein
MKIPANISDATLLAKAADAKRALNEAEATYKAYAAIIAERNVSGETDIAKVTVTKPYDRVDLDQTAVKAAFPAWQDMYGKTVHIGPSVRITFK